MFRPITVIVAALLLARPGIPQGEALRYATALQNEAKKHDFDPLTGVALIWRESRWLPSAISSDREDYGLAQIRARHIGACRHDTDPVNHPSPECQAVKQALLNGVYNIRVMGTLISRNRELCHDKIGTARFEQWLASYEGRNYPHRNQWCQPSDATREVIRYRQWLLGKIEPPPRKPATARNSPKRGKQRVAAHPQAEKTKNNTRSP